MITCHGEYTAVRTSISVPWPLNFKYGKFEHVRVLRIVLIEITTCHHYYCCSSFSSCFTPLSFSSSSVVVVSSTSSPSSFTSFLSSYSSINTRLFMPEAASFFKSEPSETPSRTTCCAFKVSASELAEEHTNVTRKCSAFVPVFFVRS